MDGWIRLFCGTQQDAGGRPLERQVSLPSEVEGTGKPTLRSVPGVGPAPGVGGKSRLSPSSAGRTMQGVCPSPDKNSRGTPSLTVQSQPQPPQAAHVTPFPEPHLAAHKRLSRDLRPTSSFPSGIAVTGDAHRVGTTQRPPRRQHAQAAHSDLAAARDTTPIPGMRPEMPRPAGQPDSSTQDPGRLPECPASVAFQKQAVPCEWTEDTVGFLRLAPRWTQDSCP